MDAKSIRSLIETITDIYYAKQLLNEIIVFNPTTDVVHIIDEGGKWIPTKTTNIIRIDQPLHSLGQTHAHVYGRKGNEIGVVNLDGSASHNSLMRLSKKDADTLRDHGFTIRPYRMVEWVIRPRLT